MFSTLSSEIRVYSQPLSSEIMILIYVGIYVLSNEGGYLDMSYLNDPDYKNWLQLTESQRKDLIEQRINAGDIRSPEKGGYEAGLNGSFPSQEDTEMVNTA